MRKNGYINNRLRMNIMLKKNSNNTNNKINNKKSIKRNNSTIRYLDMYQNEKSIKKHLLTPDINKKKSIKKTNKNYYDYDYDQLTLDNDCINIFGENEELINDNVNILSNSFDLSKSFVNIEDYMNLYFISKSKNPFLNKTKEKLQNENVNIFNNKKENIIAYYSYKNKKWLLIEEIDSVNNNGNNNIYWKECNNNELLTDITNNIDITDFNSLEEKYNSLKLEYNKMKQLFNDLNNKYEQINKKNKESQIQINYYLLKIKENEKDKEKYLKKNKKLKEEINKIPYLIEQEMSRFKSEIGRKISKKIYHLEQENKILKGERYKTDEKDNFDELKLYFNGNDENINIKK